jgi:RIO-like serine/threonine protein kinase
MDFSYLNKLSISDLKDICKKLFLKENRPRKDIIKDIIRCYDQYEEYNKNTIDKYTKLHKLGTGKEGTTYLVQDKDGNNLAMKCFKSKKSSNKISLEGELQQIVCKTGLCPQLYEIDTVNKYLVMERMDNHLYDSIKKNKGLLNRTQQKQIVNILKKLDEVLVFHADSNILNYMYKGKKLYIIDFSMSKHIDEKLIKKLGTKTPNIDYGILGFILKLKELHCDSKSYEYLMNFVSDSNKEKFNL